MSIGERITDLRKQRGLSQGDLADALSISRQAVSKWENDLSCPDTLNLIRLSEVLDTEIEYIATGRKPVYTYPVYVDKIKVVEKQVEVPVEKRVEVPVPYPVERIVEVEKVVEKPVVRRVIRYQKVRSPLEYALLGIACLTIGLIIGILI